LARKIIKQTASFGVLRANPRISGNVKITVDSNDDIWLNSIDSNQEMSNQAYKGFRISPESSYDRDLYTFFNDGQTPSQFIFGLIGEGDPIQNQVQNLADSYNFYYSAGVTPLVSDKYSEDFSYLAPLWLGEDIPDYFVIFRVNDPIDFPYQVPVTAITQNKNYKVLEDPLVDKQDPNYLPFVVDYQGTNYTDGNIFSGGTFPIFTILQGQGTVILLDPLYNLNEIRDVESHFSQKILNKSTAIATFNLKESSKIGKYLRKIKETTGYTDSLIDVRFEENQLTTFNGVNYNVGIFDKKGDFLIDFYQDPSSQIGFEEYMTDGFRRNGILSYKLLNLEFLFNDNDSENYSINRYFGLYVNAETVSTFKLDGNALFQDGGNSGNIPAPTRNDKGYYFQSFPYFQYNDNGVRLFLDPDFTKGVIPTSEDVNESESEKLFWIQDRNGDFYSLKRDENYSLTSPTNPVSTYGLSETENQLVIQNKSLDLSLLTGVEPNTTKQYYGVSTGEKGRGYFVIRVAGPLTNTNEDTIVFYHPLGTIGPPGGKYDLIKTSDMSSLVDEWGPGSFYSQDAAFYIHPFGTNEEIARALTGIFNSFNYNSFEAFQSGDEVVIRTRATGKQENTKYYLDFFQNFTTQTRMPEARRGALFFNEIDVCDINRRQSFLGGSNYANTRVKVKLEDLNKIEIGKTFLETVKPTGTDSFVGLAEYSNKSSSMVVGKFRFVDQYAKDTKGEIVGLKDFETHGTIEISNFTERVAIGSVNKISAFNSFNVPLGIFSFYGLREIDCDFWYSQYGYTPTQEYYKYLDTQSDGVTLIIPGKSYFVSAGTVIIYNSLTITGPDFFEGVAGEDSYTLVSSSIGSGFLTVESNVYPTLSSRGNITGSVITSTFDIAFYPDLDAFPGFFGIQELKFVDSGVTSNSKFAQLNFGKLASEYDYTQDNFNPSFATNSRVVPYITKWVYNRGTDVRGNGYRLNANLAFSPLNFSPSFFRNSQDPQYFTHEWYQLQKPPFSLPEENLHFDKSYLSGEISESGLINANPALRDYFLDYFSVEGEDLSIYYPNSTTIDKINLTERYTTFNFVAGAGFSETLFRGAKVRVKRSYTDFGQNESIKFLTDDRFYDEYKFSCVIVPIKNIKQTIQAPIKLKFIENRTFKNITLIIEVLIDDSRVLNFEEVSPETQYSDLDYFLLYSLRDKLTKQTATAPITAELPSGTIELPKVGDVKLSSALNISSVPGQSGIISVVNNFTFGNEGEVYIIPNPNYETDLRDEINFVYLPSTDPATLPLGSTGPGSFYGVIGTTAGGPTGGYTLPWPTGVGQGVVNFTNVGPDYEFDFVDIGLPGPTSIPTSAFFNTIKQIPIYQREGGIGYWGNILEKISFANLSLWINTGYPYIDYKTYVWNETTKTTDVLSNQFKVELLRPSALEQNAILVTQEDQNKPPELSLFNVGYTLEEVPGETELYRYSGEYIPSFREVLKFQNVKYDMAFWTMPSAQTFFVTIIDKPETSPEYEIGSLLCYAIDGVVQKEVSLTKGTTYYFDLGDASNTGYQLYFSTSNRGNSFSTDAITQGYTLVGTPGTPGSYAEFSVPYDFPSSVYYVAEGDKFMGSSIRVIEPIEYSYCSFGPAKDDFSIAKNVNFYKYSTEWIFRISKDSPFNPVYNLIGETPVDKRDVSIFESSWDPGFYRQYSDPTTYEDLPGTRSMKEQKSFFGSKAMQTPDLINSQKQSIYSSSIPDVVNVNFENFPDYEILWEETTTEIRGVLLMDRMLIRYFLDDGAKQTFQQFIVPEFGFGTLSDINDDFNEYMKLNVIPIFQSRNNGAYLKKVPVSNPASLPVIVGNLADYQKLINGYFQSSEIRFTKINELRYQFTVPKDPAFNYSLAFSIQIAKI